MSKKNPPNHLKLHVEEPVESLDVDCSHFAGWNEISDFFKSTGWKSEYINHAEQNVLKGNGQLFPISDTDDHSFGCLKFLPTPQTIEQSATQLLPNQVHQLAEGISKLIGLYFKTQTALCQREAELAACIPVIHGRDPQTNLSVRLEAVLKGGVEAVGCDSAVLFMLDEATTNLKARATYGMPDECLTNPPLPLKSAIGDLEALLGHAVVLEHPKLLQSWNVPYPCQAAVCVPVSGPMVPLGTLWMFSDQAREFTDEQVNLIEIIAGRIASDLDREMLLIESENQKTLSNQSARSINSWQDQLPHRAPLVEGWDVAGCTKVNETTGASFHDWFMLEDNRLAMMVGEATSYNSPCKITAATLRTAVRSHGQMLETSQDVLERSNELMWSVGVGAQSGSCNYALLDAENEKVDLSIIGNTIAVHLKAKQCKSYLNAQQSLGPEEDPTIQQQELKLGKKDILILLAISAEKDEMISQTDIVEVCKQVRQEASNKKAQAIAQQLSDQLTKSNPKMAMHSIVVIKHQ